MFAAADGAGGDAAGAFCGVCQSPTPAHPGEVVTVTIKVQIDPGWHVYSVVPAATGPAATEIVSAGDAAPLGQTAEDAPISHFDANFQTQVAYHGGAATFSAAVPGEERRVVGDAALPDVQ